MLKITETENELVGVLFFAITGGEEARSDDYGKDEQYIRTVLHNAFQDSGKTNEGIGTSALAFCLEHT